MFFTRKAVTQTRQLALPPFVLNWFCFLAIAAQDEGIHSIEYRRMVELFICDIYIHEREGMLNPLQDDKSWHAPGGGVDDTCEHGLFRESLSVKPPASC